MADATEDQRLPSPGCHESHPIRGRAAVPPVQVGELANVVDLHIHRGATRLAGVRQNPLEQFGPTEPLAFEGSVVDGCRQGRPETSPSGSRFRPRSRMKLRCA